MPTENESKKVFMITENGDQKEIGILESLKFEEMPSDNEKEIIKADVEISEKQEYSGSISFVITKNEMRKLKKALGVQTIKRKRFIKLLMGKGIQKRDAIKITEAVRRVYKKYEYYMVDFIANKLHKEE